MGSAETLRKRELFTTERGTLHPVRSSTALCRRLPHMLERLLQLWTWLSLMLHAEISTPGSGSTVLLVELDFNQGAVDEAVQVLTANAHGSRKQPGCHRFDVLRDQERPLHLVTYEVYGTAADLERDKAQPHTRAWGAFAYGDAKPLAKKRVRRLRPIDWGPPSTWSTSASPPQLVVVVTLDVKEGYLDEAARLLSASARGSRKEPGCVRFDVLRDEANQLRLVTYEAFTTAAAMEDHKAQPHTRAWGAFQYGDSKPILKKHIDKLSPVDFQSVYGDREIRSRL